MKQWKKLLMAFMCVSVILSVTACGRDGNADDNGAIKNNTTENNANNNTGNNGNTNDATDGTDNRNGNGEGVMDEIGDDLKNGADDVGDALDGNNVKDNRDSLEKKDNADNTNR